jgi:hypothetical protein
MAPAKQKAHSHIVGSKAERLFEDVLPDQWEKRRYAPDYGIDMIVEIFEPKEGSPCPFETLGEHVFVQLKGMSHPKTAVIAVPPVFNVERQKPTAQDDCEAATKIEVIKFSIETTELVTVQRMGAAIPVLLVAVDITSKRVFFVCLNDYIEKVLLPGEPQYSLGTTRTIYIPTANALTLDPRSLAPLRFYAKRPKLYAAFNKFHYQNGELANVDDEDLVEQAKYFATVLLRYDFWDECGTWAPIARARQSLQSVISRGEPDLMTHVADVPDEPGWAGPLSRSEHTRGEMLQFANIRTFWEYLATLGKTYEDLCRQWFLPTHIGISCRS